MQKKLIALAVAGLASAGAFAQSNVTIYGVADASFESVKADSAASAKPQSDNPNVGSRTRLNTNSSLLGFKGSEDLGNGLKALFQFESTVDLANSTPATAGYTQAPSAVGAGTGGVFGAKRDTFVALSGNFGTVLGGYVSTPYRSIVTGFDVVPGSAGSGSDNGVFGKAIGAVNLVFRTNAIAYASPSFNGFSGVIAYVPNGAKSVDNLGNQVPSANPNGWNLGLNYANGGLKLAYSYLKLTDVGIGDKAINNVTGLDSSKEDHKANLLAASYDFGQGTTLVGMYQHYKGTVDLLNAGAGVGSFDINRNSYFLGLKHVLGAHEFAVSYQHASDAGGNLLSNKALLGTNSDTGATQWTLRYGYNFSKRTQVYALYTRIDNKDNANFNFANGAVGSAANTGDKADLGTGVGAGSNPTVYGVGIRHSF